MTGKRLAVMLSCCIGIMGGVLGAYRQLWNAAEKVENVVFDEAVAFEESATDVLSEEVREGSGPLSIGDEGERVRALQTVLAARGFYEGEIDGRYGMMTGEAVRRYQSMQGLIENGKAGIATLFALGLCENEREERDDEALLAAAIELYAGGEPFGARVAVGSMILERARRLGSLALGIAYYGGEDRQTVADARSRAAARVAMEGVKPVECASSFSRKKPTGVSTKLGSIYFY